MKPSCRMTIISSLVTLLFTMSCVSADEAELSGLWMAYKNFGPEVHGELVVTRDGRNWHVDAAGYSVTVSPAAGENGIRAEFPGNKGRFEGRLEGDSLRGHWTQPPPAQIGMPMSSPVHFTASGKDRWVGMIRPRSSEYTFFMPIEHESGGETTAFLRNPDRNLGVFYNVRRIEQREGQLQFVGPFFRGTDEQTLFEGIYHSEGDYITAFLNPFRGGSYDFHRVDDDALSHFYARGANPAAYTYSAPVAFDDGWDVGTLEQADIDLAPLVDMIKTHVEPVATSVDDFYLHSVLIARHGKLVFEEYFHGTHRNLPHDTRSASKSMASMLVGAAGNAGVDIGTSTPVYASLMSDEALEAVSRRKRAMSLGHLLTMSSGFYCDDNDERAPGNENTMQEQQEEPDWYRYTLALPMSDDPGDKGIYCSANSNMIGAVLSAKTGRSVRDLFADYIAKPLNIKRYYLGLQPTGEVYLGGGAQWLPRDFMKLGQVMLNGGTWNGERIVSEEWVRDSVAEQSNLNGRAYGYQWWIAEYPYKERTVKAFFAGGNGGQLVLGIPELDLLVAFFGGNYSAAMSRHSQNVLVPEYILEAIRE